MAIKRCKFAETKTAVYAEIATLFLRFIEDFRKADPRNKIYKSTGGRKPPG